MWDQQTDHYGRIDHVHLAKQVGEDCLKNP
jgi:hypothetical protein